MRRLFASLLLVTGCLSQGSDPVSERSGAVGEPANGFPSALERLGLMAINRARSDPQTVKGPQSTSYPARPPVIWSAALNQSARFHSVNLETSDVTLMHTSPCTLNTNVATTAAPAIPAAPAPRRCRRCAPPAPTPRPPTPAGPIRSSASATSPAARAVSASGEVAAAGYGDPIAVVDGWMDEAAGSDGHRKILTDQGTTANTMGYGHASGANCWKSFDVGRLGEPQERDHSQDPHRGGQPRPAAPPGRSPSIRPGPIRRWGRRPRSTSSSTGACTSLARELGTDKLNATYKGTATLAAGCHNYYILARDASGRDRDLPDHRRDHRGGRQRQHLQLRLRGDRARGLLRG